MRALKLVAFIFAFAVAGCAGAHVGSAIPPAAGTQSLAKRAIATCPCYSDIYDFGSMPNDGAQPVGLTVYNGALYGATTAGGSSNAGTVFRLGFDGSNYSQLYAFSGQNDGGYPLTQLVETNGTLYGVAEVQNFNYVGSLYTVSASTVTPGGSLNGNWNLSTPFVRGGTFYGTSQISRGSVYSLTPQSGISTLYSFGQYPSSVFAPVGGLVGLDGVLYGVATSGGTYNDGGLYWVSYSGQTMRVVHQFSTSVFPTGVVAFNGSIFGVTQAGGKYGQGTVFEFTPVSKTWRVLHEFGGSGDLTGPGTPVVMNGVLYGVASGGGANGLGGIYSVGPNAAEKVVYSFTVPGAAYAGPLTAYNGTLYGVIGAGGPYNGGWIFSLQP